MPKSHKMRRYYRVLAAVALGAAGFWLPDLLISVIFRTTEPLWLVTLLLPASSGLAYLAGDWFWNHKFRQSVWMLVGIYLAGPVAMLATLSLKGGTGGIPLHILLLYTVVPAYSFVMATYDLSLGALIIVTLGLIAVRLTIEHRRSLHSAPEAPIHTLDDRGRAASLRGADTPRT